MADPALSTANAFIAERIGNPDINLFHLQGFFAQQRWDTPTKQFARDCIAQRLRNEPISIETINVLNGCYDRHGIHLVDHEIQAIVFRKIEIPLTDIPIGFLTRYLREKKYSVDRKVTGDVRRSVCSWFSRIAHSPSTHYLQTATADDVHIERVKLFLVWVSKLVKSIEESTTLEWCVRVYLENLCTERGAKLTLSNIAPIYSDYVREEVDSLVLRILNDVVVLASTAFRPVAVVDMIFPNQRYLTLAQQQKTTLHHRMILREIMLQAVLLLNESTLRSDEGDTFNSMFHDSEKTKRIDLLSFCKHDGHAWFAFLVFFHLQEQYFDWIEENFKRNQVLYQTWARQAPAERKQKEMKKPEIVEFLPRMLWKSYQNYATMIQVMFKRMVPLIEEKKCRIEFLGFSGDKLYDPYYQQCWELLHLEEVYQKSVLMQEESEKLQMRMCLAKSVADTLFPDDPLTASIEKFLKSFHSFTLKHARVYLRLESDEPTAAYLASFQTSVLPASLLSSLDWLKVMCKSSLFLSIFNVCKETGVQAIEPAAKKLAYYFHALQEKTILFPELRSISIFLKKGKERAALFVGGVGWKENEDKTISWSIQSEMDTDGIRDLGLAVKDWIHLDRIHSLIGNARRVLASLPMFLSEKAMVELQSVQQSIERLDVQFKSQDFDKLTLAQYVEYHKDAIAIDDCLLTTSGELFEVIPKCMDLLDWLRSLPNDNDFTSSVELAMGKNEMECPASLWEEEPGKPGRVSEEKLSMVSTVRRYLYSIIYRTQIYFPTLEDLLAVLRELRPTDQNILDSLRISAEHTTPLMELLSDTQCAPDRLLSLLLPDKKSTWICSNSFDPSIFAGVTNDDVDSQDRVGQVWLEWQVPHGNEIELKRQNITELMDFQSTVVLGATDTRREKYQGAIDNFIQQFGWMKQLWNSLSQLHKAGHFDFRTFKYEFPIQCSSIDIRDLATKASAYLVRWTEKIEEEKKKCYFLNFFGIRHLWSVVSTLDGAEDSEVAELEYKNLLACVNLDCIADIDIFDSFVVTLKANWKMQRTSADETLEVCGAALQAAFATIPPRSRPVEILDIYKDQVSLSGLHVIAAESPAKVFDHVLSAYARAGFLPEYTTAYICSKQSHWEDLSNLIARWEGAAEHGRADRLYCIASIELLSFDDQRKLVSRIRDAMNKAINPLLLISGRTENQHIITQFSHCRINNTPLPTDTLIQYAAELSNYSQGISVFTGSHAGCGKTFQIRSRARHTLSEYFHFPVLSSRGILDQITQCDELMYPLGFITAHFDVADSIGEEFGSLLFNLAFLGRLYDSTSGTQYYWDPEYASLAFEIPAPVKRQVRLVSFLPEHHCIVTEHTFLTNEDALRNGMGEAFHSGRYDGTSLRILKEGEKLSVTNAYERLRYVSLALQILEKNAGRFPYIDESVGNLDIHLEMATRASGMVLLNKEKNAISSSAAFALISQAIEWNEAAPSLWCLWNFVNVFYWQLRDMHHPESPINCACMPDEYSEREDDEDGKAKIKGEVIQFLIRTAREFATRQQHKEDSTRIVSCRIEKMSRWEFNGMWARMEYDNDGHMCFRKNAGGGVLYMYYRMNAKQWVIDDIMEASGATFASSSGEKIDSQWSSSPDWKLSPAVKLQNKADNRGYNGKAIYVSGTETKVKGESSNGIYLLQPPYDNIAGHPHYILDKGAYRRHLFWSEIEQLWQICPVCNNEEGAYALSASGNMLAQWKTIPPDVVEHPTFEMITHAKWQVYSGAVKPPVKEKEAVEEEEEGEKEEGEVIDESYLELDQMERIWENTVKWNDSNHECLLFSNEVHVVRFLSLDPKKMKDRMHPGLLNHLVQNKINVGEDLDTLNGQFHNILSSITEIKRSHTEGMALLEGKYCLTGDSLLKMLAIFARLRCGVPVVLMGECGCGKTMLIKYLCAWMNVRLLILDVHGGTAEEDILNLFDEATALLDAHGKNDQIFVFLDEINTCSHMALMNEAISHRSLRGKSIDGRIHILAALNPYRKRPERENTPGLVYQLHGSSGPLIDPMAKLVYRVHPIPHALRDFIFDFGSLTPEKEMIYIFSMVSTKFNAESEAVRQLVAQMISASQEYIRQVEHEASSTSLRDVRRALHLIEFFSEKVNKTKQRTSRKPRPISPFACSVILGLAFVYFYRLGKNEDREGYWEAIGRYSQTVNWDSRGLKGNGFDGLKKDGACQKLLSSVQQNFCDNVRVEDGIAMNQALMENLFVVLICILNKIPVFLVGKPGSSKTLTMQVIASNLQGKQSEIAFWRKFPAIYIFQYQCSPMSDSHSIQHQFDMAVRYQQHAENTITVLLLDEVGLAEHSPDMPLKVLHGMLVDPPVSVVGLSNWVLDPAKMNRAICLQRTEPGQDDIQLTGKRILSSSPGEGSDNHVIIRHLTPLLAPLASAYHSIYTKQKGRDFVGMRDYYNLVKLLRSQLSRSATGKIDEQLLTFSLCRNFGGKPQLMSKILSTFHKQCFKLKFDKSKTPSVQQLISANLNDSSARHLMLLTKNGAALPLLFGTRLIDELEATVLIGSEFPDDRTELHLVTQINQVKLAMASGSTVILLNHDNIYEALYDVLNQRYLYKSDVKSGKVMKLLRLAIGSRSQLCTVKDGFKIIVIVEQEHAYSDLDLPLLNRFEKQVLCPENVLTEEQKGIVKNLIVWIEDLLKETRIKSVQELFCGFHRGTIPSALLDIVQYGRVTKHAQDIERELKFTFSKLALPIAMITSPTLRSLNTNYFRDHASFSSIVHHFILPSEDDSCNLLLTYSPSSHVDDILTEDMQSAFSISHIQLSEISGERVLQQQFATFFQGTTLSSPASLLLVQCDPLTSSQTLIDHARHICTQARALYKFNETTERSTASDTMKHVIFLIHLPPGLKERQRKFSLDIHSSWKYLFVDDLRAGTKENSFDTTLLLETSVYQLVMEEKLILSSLIHTRFQYALSCCTVPSIQNVIGYYSARIHTYRDLLTNTTFLYILEGLLLSSLKFHNTKNAQSLYKHVEMASVDLAGSLRQSLELAMDTMCLQALAHAFRLLDTNFNISLAHSDTLRPLWLKLAQHKLCVNPETFAANTQIGSPSFSVPASEIPNTGTHAPVMNQFPFSHKILPLLNQQDLQKKIRENEGNRAANSLAQTCKAFFGEALFTEMEAYGNGYHSAYLHDYVATETFPIPGLSVAQKQAIYEIVLITASPTCLTSIASVHIGIWENEDRLFAYCSLLSCSLLPVVLRTQIIESLRLQSSAEVSTEDEEASRNRLIELDIRFLDRLFSSMWDRFADAALNKVTLELWQQQLSSISTDVTFLLLSGSELPAFAPLYQSFHGLRLASIFLSEIGSHFIGSGELPNKVVQFRKIALNCNFSSVSYFKALMATVLYGLEQDEISLALIGNFVRRFVQEIVFGDQEGFSTLCTQHALDRDLFLAFEWIINASDDNSMDPNLQVFPLEAVDLPLRRVLVHCLVRAKENGFLSQSLNLYTKEGQQVYLQYWEDLLSNQSQSAPFNLSLTEETVIRAQLIPTSQSSPAEWLEYLKAVASCRCALHLFALEIIELQRNNSPKGVILCYDDSMALVKLLERKFGIAALLTLKILRNRAGIDSVIDLIALPETFAPWLVCNRSVLTEGISLCDPFPILLDALTYEDMAAKVRLIATSTTQDLPVLKAANRFDLCASLFSQVIIAQTHVSPKAVQKIFKEWVPSLPTETDFEHDFYDFLQKLAISPASCPYVTLENSIDMALLQIMTHVAIFGMKEENHFLSTFMRHPEHNRTMYIPCVSSNALAEAIAASGHVGWYLCPKGHPYSVGGCTLPMETSICLHPGCGAIIGGKHHVSVRGVKKIDINALQNQTKSGFAFDLAQEAPSKYSRLNTAIIRLLVHVALASGCLVTTKKATKKSLCNQLEMDSSTSIGAKLLELARNNLLEIMNQLELGVSDTTLAIHLVLRSMRDGKIGRGSAQIPSIQSLRVLEMSFVNCINNTVQGIRSKLACLSGQLEQGSRISSAILALGDQWDLIHEVGPLVLHPTLEQLLWRYREPVTFEHFTRQFSSRSATQKTFPLLHAFLKEESRLHVIKYTADILAWHSILFEMFPPSTLTRDAAMNITNAQAIEENLPKHRHTRAFRILRAFCVAFNECLPMIERIFECEANPFISSLHGMVDLSGGKKCTGGVLMSEEISIAFSLPSMVRGANDAMGLCTIKLLDMMQGAQSEVLSSLGRGVDGKMEEVPSMSHMTPMKIIRQQLIMYDRSQDLMPLLRIFARQSLKFGEGVFLEYDVASIEGALANMLVGGKFPVKLQIRHFQYEGDVKKAGFLSELYLCVPQRSLNHSTLESIWQEIDTRDRLMQLMRQLDMCISFIVSVAGSAHTSMDGNVFLNDYMLNTLLMDRDVWGAITTQSVTQHVQLCHIQCLYMELEEKMYGSPLDNVEEVYREFLPEMLQKEILGVAKQLDLSALIPILRHFLVEQLCQVEWDAKAPLKIYLTFVSAAVDLEDLDWYNDHFPDSLQLQHAYHFYYQLLALV